MHAVVTTKIQTHDLAEDCVKLTRLTTTIGIWIVKNWI
jgi:hypothetical protein